MFRHICEANWNWQGFTFGPHAVKNVMKGEYYFKMTVHPFLPSVALHQCCISHPSTCMCRGGGILLCFQILLRSLASNSCYSLVNIHFTKDKIFLHKVIEKLSINPLSAYPTKWSNTLKQFGGYIFTRYDLYQTFITYIANWKKIICGSTRLLD